MKILLADDHPIFRKGLKALLSDHFAHSTIVEVDNGKEAIEQFSKMDFTICILDIDMPEKSGIEVLTYIKENSINTKSLILTMHNDEMFFNESFNKGAIGFLLKEDSSLEIVDCIEHITAGIPFVSKKLEVFLKNRKSYNSKLNETLDALKSLSNAELNTLKLVAQNKTSKEISELLFVTEKSIENYRSRICKKLNLSGASNVLYRWTIENKNLITNQEV